jgi:hypothetical protein
VMLNQLWIEAECWAEGSWDPLDSNSDVVVTLADESRWSATFLTYANVATLVASSKHTGECLAGAYLWVEDMILIDEVSRPRIGQIVSDLIAAGDFARIFTQLEEDGDFALPPCATVLNIPTAG